MARDEQWRSIAVALAEVEAALEADVRTASSLVAEAETVEHAAHINQTHLSRMEVLRTRIDELGASVNRQRNLLQELRDRMRQLRAQRPRFRMQ